MNIFQNLAIIFQSQKKPEKAYELLKSLVKHIKPENISSQNAEIIVSSFDNLYINLANLCYTLRNYAETVLYAKLGVNFLQSVLRNAELLGKIEQLLQKNHQEIAGFLTNKRDLLAYLLHLIGKCEVKTGNRPSAITYFQQAYTISRENHGESEPRTQKYKRKSVDLQISLENQRNSDSFLENQQGLSPNQSPNGKKARFIKSFVKKQENSGYLLRKMSVDVGFSEKNAEKNESFKEISPELVKNLDNMRIKTATNEEKSTNFEQIRVFYPTNSEFFTKTARNLEKPANTHTNSLPNASEIRSFLIKPRQNSGKAPYLRGNFVEFNENSENVAKIKTNTQTSRTLLYNTSAISTRPTPKAIKTPISLANAEEIAGFQRIFSEDAAFSLNTPKKYLFFLNKRPAESAKTNENARVSLKKPENSGKIDKVPSITINSMAEIIEFSLKNRLKTPKSSFSSLKTPKMQKTTSAPQETSGFLLRNSLTKRNISIKIPEKAGSPSKTANNTALLQESSRKKPGSSGFHANNSRKFSIPTGNLPLSHGGKPVTNEFSLESPGKLTKFLKKDAESPTKLKNEPSFPLTSSVNNFLSYENRDFAIFPKKLVGSPLKNEEKPEKLGEKPEKDHEKPEKIEKFERISEKNEKNNEKPEESQRNIERPAIFERAARVLQRNFRIFLEKRRENARIPKQRPSFPLRLSKGAEKSPRNSTIYTKISPRRDESLTISKKDEGLPQKDAENNEIINESSQISEAFEEEAGNFFEFKLLMPKRTRFWSVLDCVLGKNQAKSQFFVSFSLRNCEFNTFFSWNLVVSSKKWEKRRTLFEFLDALLEKTLENLSKTGFFHVESERLRESLQDLPRELQEKLTKTDQNPAIFLEFLIKLAFFLENFFVARRKVVGKTYIFHENLTNSLELRFFEQELQAHLRAKRQFIKSLICGPCFPRVSSANFAKVPRKLRSFEDVREKPRIFREEFSLFSRISSPVTSETNYQRSKGLPPLRGSPPTQPQGQRPSISLSVCDNHIKLIKKGENPNNFNSNFSNNPANLSNFPNNFNNFANNDAEDYKFQTLTQPPVLLTQLRTALSTKELNKSLESRKDSTVREVSEEIIDLSSDSREKRSISHENEKISVNSQENEQQSVIIRKDQVSNEYISIENAIKSGVLRLRSGSGSPLSPSRRFTSSPSNRKTNRLVGFMKKSLTVKPEDPEFHELFESVVKNSDEDVSLVGNLRKMSSFTRKKLAIKQELTNSQTIFEETSPRKALVFKEMSLGDFKFQWTFAEQMRKGLPCPSGLFSEEKLRENMYFPEKLVDLFENDELLLEEIVKLQRHFFVLLIFVEKIAQISRVWDFVKEIDGGILKKYFENLRFRVKLLQISSFYRINYDKTFSSSDFDAIFLDNSLQNPLELLRFFHYRRFSARVLPLLLRNLKKISIENCDLRINPIKSKEMQGDAKKSLEIRENPASFQQKNAISGEIPHEICEKHENDSLILHDPEIKRLKYYNSIKILNKSRYYSRFSSKNGAIYLRVQLFSSPEAAKVSIYMPFLKKTLYVSTKSLIVFEKLVNFLQTPNKKFRETLLSSFFPGLQQNFIAKTVKFDVCKRVLHAGDEKLFEGDFNFFYNFTQNIFSKRDNPIIYHYFSINTFFESHEIENMGRAYVKVSLFQLKVAKKSLFPHNFSSFLLFEIYQNSITRYKLQKFILTVEDIAFYVNFRFSLEKLEELLPQLNKNVLKNFVYAKNKLYKSLHLPFHKFSQSTAKKFSLLKMDLNKFSLKQTGLSTFLKPELNAYRIIFQGIKKVFGLFAVVTVKKHHFLKFWSIGFYFPKTNREFSISLYNSDIFRMTPRFFEELFPISMKEIQEILTECKMKRINYHTFSEKYQEMMVRNRLNLKNSSVSEKYSKIYDTPFFANSKLLMNFVEIKVNLYKFS